MTSSAGTKLSITGAFLPEGGRRAEPTVELDRRADGGAAVSELLVATRVPLTERRPEAWEEGTASVPRAAIPIIDNELVEPPLERGRLLVGVWQEALEPHRPLRREVSFAILVPLTDKSRGIATLILQVLGKC